MRSVLTNFSTKSAPQLLQRTFTSLTRPHANVQCLTLSWGSSSLSLLRASSCTDLSALTAGLNRLTVSTALSNTNTQVRAFSGVPKQPQKKKYPPAAYIENGLKRFRPITPSLRHTVLVDRSHLWKGRPIRELTVGLRKKGGRGHGGRICVVGRGGGHKRRYRFIDFKRSEVLDQLATVQRLEYDPNRTAWIALLSYPDGTLSYIVAPRDLKVGDTVESTRTREIPIKPGNCMPINFIPLGTSIHNIEIAPGRGAQMCRTAGGAATLLEKLTQKKDFALVELPSKEQRLVSYHCMATIGVVSNPLHSSEVMGKAGRNRWKGRRPKVRGVAKNPVDHPMGGGEGRSSGGRPACNFKGLLAKGFKTRKRVKNPHVLVPRGGIKKLKKKQ